MVTFFLFIRPCDSAPRQHSFYKGHEPVSCGRQGSDWFCSSFHRLHKSTVSGHGLPDVLASRASWHCLFGALASDTECRDKGFLQPSPNMPLLGLHLEKQILKSFTFFETFIFISTIYRPHGQIFCGCRDWGQSCRTCCIFHTPRTGHLQPQTCGPASRAS